MNNNGFLNGKNALIMGVLNNRSIAYGIARAMQQQGANIALTYQNEKLLGRVEKVATELNAAFCVECDVSQDENIKNMAVKIKQHWQHIDIVVHSMAFAPADQLKGSYVENATRDSFALANNISSYSFVAIAKELLPLMQNREAAMLTMSYIGASRFVPNYNLMGVAKASLEANVRYMAGDLGQHNIRVNAISAGPVKTLASAGIKDFRKMLNANIEKVPLKRATTITQVGNAAAFLCSELASGITGEVLFVDNGFHMLV